MNIGFAYFADVQSKMYIFAYFRRVECIIYMHISRFTVHISHGSSN